MTKTIEERRALVQDMLRPDDIRNHRVAEGLAVTRETMNQIEEIASLVAIFNTSMGSLSQDALQAQSSDRLMRTIRQVLGTEPLYQAIQRGEVNDTTLPNAQIIKTDVILTSNGPKIAEIEPGKLRGIGYGHMVRQQSEHQVGIGATTALPRLVGEGAVLAVILSEADRFHEPEMAMVDRDSSAVLTLPQRALTTLQGRIMRGDTPLTHTAMMTSFRRGIGQTTEEEARALTEVVSDRRPDLESKGSVALLHNAGMDADIEMLLLESFGSDALVRLRNYVPFTVHPMLSNREQLSHIAKQVRNGELSVFLKPVTASGTRGIITPDMTAEIVEVLGDVRLARKYVIQTAEDTVPVEMQSRDVLIGDDRTDTMNIRLTLHSDTRGEIVEASVVGSPHQYLAHGGKTSVITNLEVSGE